MTNQKQQPEDFQAGPAQPEQSGTGQSGTGRIRNDPGDPALAAFIANRLTSKSVMAGDIANLRKMRPEAITNDLFWRIMLECGLTDPESYLNDLLLPERTWAEIVPVIAAGIRVGQRETTTSHDEAVPLGKALAEAGFHENRLNALLNAHEGSIGRLAAQAAGFLHSKGASYNCVDLARLMLMPLRSQAQRDADRTYTARQYYRALYAAEAGQNAAAPDHIDKPE